MNEWERNGEASMKHNEMKYYKTNETKLRNIQKAQQAQTYRLDRTAKNRTLLVEQLP
jgi:hypothetical protein